MFPKFEIFGEVFYSYPLVLGVIWAIGFEYSKALNKNLKHFNLLFFILFIAAWVGAKILFLLTLDDQTLEKISSNTNFWLGGGFVFLGGLIGGLGIVAIHKLYFKQRIFEYEFLLLPLTLGHALGRIGCFLAGCCYGTSCDLFWSIHLHGLDRHPVQLYEAFSLFVLFGVLRFRWRKGQSLLPVYLGSYFLLRFSLEFFRGDKIRGVYWMGLSTSQFISIAGFLCLLGWFALRKRV